MIIIFGTRFYGEVGRYGGQRQLTRFFHLYYLPLIPVGTMWVIQDVESGYHGHDVKVNGRSVVAGYARVWGPLVALFTLASGSVGGFIASGALLALTAWSWTWRSVRGARERRRSEYHLLALGTCCDPLRMDVEVASLLKIDVARKWEQYADGKTPEDVARFGAANPAQAVLAYASLRLAARLAPGEQARKAREASERVLDACKDTDLALEGGPYRAIGPAQLPEGIAVTDRGSHSH
jgi:hypothetical protein